MLCVLAAVAFAQGQAEEMRLMRYPDIYGDTVVFTYAADLWTVDRKGGIARRLTSHPGSEARAKFSPDGKWIAFTAEYEGNADVYVMPSEGGEPKRLTFEPESDLVIAWTPDGKVAYRSVHGTFNGKQARLWLVDPKGGPAERTAVQEISDGTFSPDGKTIAYNRTPSHQFNWRRYRGGTQGRISLFELATNKYSELPSRRENSWFPLFVGDGIFYASDRNQGTVNLYRFDLKARRDQQITKYADSDVRWPETDGKTIVFERDGFLYALDIASGNTEKLTARVLSDNVSARPALRSLGGSISDLSLSPSGSRIAVEARGELFSVPQKNGETRNLTGTPASRERFPRWSPDGQTVAFACDATGEFEVYSVPQLGGKATQLTTAKLPINGLEWSPDGKKIALTTRSFDLWILDVESKKVDKVADGRYGPISYDFSPDSKWIVFPNQVDNFLNALFLFEVGTGKTTQISDGYYDDASAAFDQNGKYLYIVSARTFAPQFGHYELAMAPMNLQRIYVIPLSKDTANPLVPAGDEEQAKPAAGAPAAAGVQSGGGPQVKIDFEGLSLRAIPLPMPAGQYPMITGVNNGVLYLANNALTKFDLGSRESQPILAQAAFSAGSLNASKSKVAYFSGGSLFLLDIRPGAQPQRVDTAGVEAVIDYGAEWRQMFWEAWRYMRDNFYDPGMAGVDWTAVGRQYEKYLPYVKHRADLNYVFGLMIGELGTGHAYVSGGDTGAGPAGISVGLLGCDYEVEGDHVRFKKIFRGAQYDEGRRGPLGDPGVTVNDGDYLLEIDGKPVNRGVNPASLLVRKGGRSVVLTVNSKPSLEGARKERVRPISSELELRYWDWVEGNRKKVAEMSGGRIGYMHIPDTQVQGTIEFMRGYWSQVDKDAVIVDERWNGGGFIQPWFVTTLARRAVTGYVGRHHDTVPDAVAIDGPKAMLINQYAGSGGDLFPWMFKQAGLGPLIGMRTWGGLVGISGFAPLSDGGGITAPEFGLFDPKEGKWIAENTGVDPDIEVDLRPDLWAQGRDPQLEKAVEYLMNELKKPRQPGKKPEFKKTIPPK